jgi:hypothetical protein
MRTHIQTFWLYSSCSLPLGYTNLFSKWSLHIFQRKEGKGRGKVRKKERKEGRGGEKKGRKEDEKESTLYVENGLSFDL